ncbi:protein bark beetle [Condylostylus longicornis]|uniref:protein bark beetle n=1 Tax=Condylostylus longicornis TaxID=2530218 RepID=UPI00244E4A55|nr:protein bark beetle [Condylostylus longicornis]
MNWVNDHIIDNNENNHNFNDNINSNNNNNNYDSYNNNINKLSDSNNNINNNNKVDVLITDFNSGTELKDQKIIGEKYLRKSNSPYIVRSDIEIENGAKLIIEPGVKVFFAPMVGIDVKGILNAVGTPNDRILLSSLQESSFDSQTLPEIKELGARLVDGPSPLQGRLQVYYKGRWRSVCSNSKNWTISDYEIVCRQMGYQGGNFWNWIERVWNNHPRLLFEEPNCRGTESSLFECSWHTRQLGSGVCDYHSDIGIQCLPRHDKSLPHWRGIRFINAPHTSTLALDNTNYISKSESILEYIDIIKAGSGNNRITTAAVEVIGMPPQMSHITIEHSAFTGLNITKSEDAFTLHHITIKKSKGFGIFVNTSSGSAHFEDCNISENGADGIRYVGHDLRSDERKDRTKIHDFCTLPTTSGQTYPISISVQQSLYAGGQKECSKYFITKPGYVLTVHFVYFTIMQNETAQIDLFDGSSTNDRLLATWLIRNSTRLQSVVSTRDKIFVRFRANPRAELLGYLKLTTGPSKSYDLNVTNTIINDNSGRGIAIDNLRSQIHVLGSFIMNNGHVSGLHVTSGAGDVNVTNSKISFNHGDGINITYYGGHRNVSRTSLSSNTGNGFAVWLNETNDLDRMEFLFINQTTTIEYSKIISNLEIGVRHGNFCGPMWVNITGNYFNDSVLDSVNIGSCWFEQKALQNRLNLQIGHNKFEYNQRNAIALSPALNLIGKIEYNRFRYGRFGSILVRNPAWEEFQILPVRIIVHSNEFYNNQGSYVISLGVTPYSDRDTQSILFTRNYVKDNVIKEPFGTVAKKGEGPNGSGRLNPRSRVAATIVVSSNNVEIFRNIISNPHSAYEIGSQFSDQREVINATFNYLGETNEEKVFDRLFHRKDRYDLAKIEYIPYLLHRSNPGTTSVLSIPQFVPKFLTTGSEFIGGEVDGLERITPGDYTVTKDINIRPGGKLIIEPGVKLYFEPSVGMMVAGKLEARGRRPNDIMFTLKREPVMFDDNDAENIHHSGESENMQVVDIETGTVMNASEPPEVPIRLLGGNTNREGRLQVYLDGRWGTVCDYGWSIISAALVCNQLGYALNPMDWRMLQSEIPGSGTTEDVLLSNVRCTEHDTDVTKCQAERASRGEFENSCTHENDVGMRCYEGAWAGLRFSALAERADLQYITVEKAGLFDYTTNSFKAAIQLDFARHNFDNIRVINNLHDGMSVIYSHIFTDNVNNVKDSEFSHNNGNGISLKQLGLMVDRTEITDNLGSGIAHNPVLSAIEQRELSGWFYIPPDFSSLDLKYDPYMLPSNDRNIDLEQYDTKHILTERHFGEEVERKINIRCPPGYVIGIQLLNPIENRSTEEIFIFDSRTENSHSDIWQVKRDLSVFPMTSSSYGVILLYKSGTRALGGTVLHVSILGAPVQNIRNKIVRGPEPTLKIQLSQIKRNFRGISGTYYNRYLGEKGEHFLRKANESIKINYSEISNNKHEAIYIEAPFWDVHVSNLSETTIHVNNSLIMNNGQGIRQFSKDLRSSNNLYHYVLQSVTIEGNYHGGMDISLPYVWQYNENFTHSIYLNNNTWKSNSAFEISIKGHYAQFNMSSNVFINNICKTGLVTLRGMEKKIKIDNNRIEKNNAQFIFEFKADSLSEIMGEVPAVVTLNSIENNKYDPFASHRPSHLMTPLKKLRSYIKDPTTVIKFGGIQKAHVTRNIFSNNEMDYDLIAGIKSARIKNYLLAQENWWGTTDPDKIVARIFDFDDWNNHAEVIYEPYLIEPTFDGSISIISSSKVDILDLDQFGGRILNDVTINRRDTPYFIQSDLTVMPDATLSINHGVVMEFSPNVGILVLGTLRAVGFRDSEIIMRAARSNQSMALNRFERSIEAFENLRQYDSIRLCTGRNCSSSENEDDKYEGFLEYFNHTTRQWVPICDRRFTERNAQVVCRELGFDPINIYYSHDRRIEFHTNSLTRIWSWVEPMECHGGESRFELCPERLNGQLYGRRHECHWDDQFVFVSCNGIPNNKNYWGGIRFANSDFEELKSSAQQSQLEFVRIEQAGMLHNEKSPAIEAVYKTPSISYVTINDSVHHGINLISPVDTIRIQYSSINNVLGNGINIISMTGESRPSDESSFSPLKNLDLPYNIFSMIDICDTMKEITIEERVILYYKYDNNPVNCVKIFETAHRVKPIGFRLLQANLFNHSKEYGRTDALHLYDGDIYNMSSIFIDKIEANSPNENRFFKTKGSILSVRLIASGAPAFHGFFAEVVTVPISTIGFNRGVQHNITYTEISNSNGGAVAYSSAGELTPILTFERNRFEKNCRQLYGNFSTCEQVLNIDVQNMPHLYFMNNLISENQGGLRIRADSRGRATTLDGEIQHNLFVKNKNRPCLQVEGRQSSLDQKVTIFKNYFSQNKANYEVVIRLQQVVSNFTHNYVHSNQGGRIMEISGFDNVRLNDYQTTVHNGFYDNVATDWRGRATIVAGTAGQKYTDNIFYNPDNDYEIMTVNRSMIDYQFWRNSTVEIWKTKVDARYNYWSYNQTISVKSRVRDKSDDPILLEVEVIPFHMNNKTILDEKCPPGWSLVLDTCYSYVGSPMTFNEARDFCRSDNASVPFIRADSTTLWTFLQKEMSHLKYPQKVWVQDLNYIDRCTSFIYQSVEIEECDLKLSFICEIDPKVVIAPLSWRADVFTISIISAFIIVVLLLFLIGLCWYAKSKHRHVQRLERRNSIRQSLRSLNSIDPQGSIRRRNFATSSNTLTKGTSNDYKKMHSNGSIDSMDKSVLESEASFETFDRSIDNGPNDFIHQNGYGRKPIEQLNGYYDPKKPKPISIVPAMTKTATVGSTRSAGKSRTYGLPDYNPPATNYDLAFRNEGFRDNSTFSGTRNNSLSTNLTEDTPIIHQTDNEDNASDYYGNASTLPLSNKNDNLSFLSELKTRLPEYDSVAKPNQGLGHSSFFPHSENYDKQNQNRYPPHLQQQQQETPLPYHKKIDQFNFTPTSGTSDSLQGSKNDLEIRRPDPVDIRRPDSYYTAMRSSKASQPIQQQKRPQQYPQPQDVQQHYQQPSPSNFVPNPSPQISEVQKRPKTVYKPSNDNQQQYQRSKSEALLETNFDAIPEMEGMNSALQQENRSYSQPLETAM